MHLTGIHHITAVCGNAAQNVAFYTGVLGLKMIKKTVNFDDPSTYHLYYGDPDGFPLELVESADHPQTQPPLNSEVPEAFALRGFIGATLMPAAFGRSVSLLIDVMGAERHGLEGNRHRFTLGEGRGSARIDVIEDAGAQRGIPGAGTVHHIAWRTPDDASEVVAREELVNYGIHVSPVIDRHYFHSIYYREPGGVLYEIATDPPGFGVDEPIESLGEKLMLPEWLEKRRKEIEQNLPPLS